MNPNEYHGKNHKYHPIIQLSLKIPNMIWSSNTHPKSVIIPISSNYTQQHHWKFKKYISYLSLIIPMCPWIFPLMDWFSRENFNWWKPHILSGKIDGFRLRFSPTNQSIDPFLPCFPGCATIATGVAAQAPARRARPVPMQRDCVEAGDGEKSGRVNHSLGKT